MALKCQQRTRATTQTMLRRLPRRGNSSISPLVFSRRKTNFDPIFAYGIPSRFIYLLLRRQIAAALATPLRMARAARKNRVRGQHARVGCEERATVEASDRKHQHLDVILDKIDDAQSGASP